MLIQNNILTIFILLLGILNFASGQTVGPDSSDVVVDQVIAGTDSVDASKSPSAEKHLWSNVQFTGGQLTLPFKIRPKADTRSFRLTTDVTVGAYVGLIKRLSQKKNYALIIPVAAGLTFININDSNTSFDHSFQEAEVVPGLSWCTGVIFQLEQYSLGLMFGKDYASDIGDEWKYHRKIWWSFGIGFTFFH